MPAPRAEKSLNWDFYYNRPFAKPKANEYTSKNRDSMNWKKLLE